MKKETKKELECGQKICKNGKKWGSHNSYHKESYLRKMADAVYKGARTYNADGYILISVKVPGRIKRKTMLEHRYLMEQHIGRPLEIKEEVHHINEIKDDNDISNLLLCANRQEHVDAHAAMREMRNA